MNITLQRIRQLADEQGRTLTYLCEKIGMKGRSYFTDIEKKSRKIPEDKLQILADTLGTTTDYLLGKTDSPKPFFSSAKKVSPFLVTPENEKESRVLFAYRSHPEMQPAVDKLLGITDDGNVTLYTAAKSAENHKPEITQMPKDKWDTITTTPETEEDLL